MKGRRSYQNSESDLWVQALCARWWLSVRGQEAVGWGWQRAAGAKQRDAEVVVVSSSASLSKQCI